MNLAKNFTLAEFTRSQTALRRGISNEPNAEHLANMIALCKHIMQPIRDGIGALIIASGYRSPVLNKAIGGSTTSQHSLGQADDFGVALGLDSICNGAFANAIGRLAQATTTLLFFLKVMHLVWHNIIKTLLRPGSY